MSSLALHDRARARWSAADLDRRLAEGADPYSPLYIAATTDEVADAARAAWEEL
jgi:hypothetical protein